MAAILTTGYHLLFGKGEIDYNLDPMLTMVQLGILGFMPTKTKISFRINSMEILREGYISQSWTRTINADDHGELDQLKPIIENAIRYYHPKKDEKVREIFSYAIKGLEQLHDTYTKLRVRNIPGTLENFIKILKVNTGNISGDGLEGFEVLEVEANEFPTVYKKVVAIWNKESYVEVLEYFRTAKTKQGDIPVDTDEKGAREMKLIETFVAHKANKLNYILSTELSMNSV